MDDRKRDQIRNLSSNKLSDLTQAASRAAMNGDRNAARDLTMAAMYKAKKEYGMDPSDYMKPKKGCFITSAVCESFGKPDDCYELTMFRSFRDNYLAKEQDGEIRILRVTVDAADGKVRTAVSFYINTDRFHHSSEYKRATAIAAALVMC